MSKLHNDGVALEMETECVTCWRKWGSMWRCVSVGDTSLVGCDGTTSKDDDDEEEGEEAENEDEEDDEDGVAAVFLCRI